jgi:hypothetical protein
MVGAPALRQQALQEQQQVYHCKWELQHDVFPKDWYLSPLPEIFPLAKV